MGNVSEHFNRSEFACKCGCGFDAVDVELLECLESVRRHYRLPVIVTSGCRCAEWNVEWDGSLKSKHLWATAADFHVPDVPCGLVYELVDGWWGRKYGMGRYETWVHLDVRRDKVRW